MEITNLHLATLAIFAIAVVVYMMARSESVERVTRLAKEREDEKAMAEREADERARRRMVHEADSYNEAANMEPFCGEGDKP